jgi:DNA-binding transcriptional LysR family regulator
MELLYLTAIGIALYWISDRLLDRIERARGRRFEERTVVFFLILASLALTSFWLLRRLLAG